MEQRGMECLAWALMSNHVHQLLRPSENNLGQFLRRLLTGHAVLMGSRGLPGQHVDEVLLRISMSRKSAGRNYEASVADGVARGKREELVGGGLRRVLKAAGDGLTSACDDRILGSGDFVDQLRREKGLSEKLEACLPLDQLMEKVAEASGIDRAIFCELRRGAGLPEAKTRVATLRPPGISALS